MSDALAEPNDAPADSVSADLASTFPGGLTLNRAVPNFDRALDVRHRQHTVSRNEAHRFAAGCARLFFAVRAFRQRDEFTNT